MHVRGNSSTTTECPQERKVEALPGKTVVDTSLELRGTATDEYFVIFVDYLFGFRSDTVFLIIDMVVFDLNSTDYGIGTGSRVAE